MLEELEQYFLNAIGLRLSSKVKSVGSELSIVLKVKNENVLSYTYDAAEKYNLSVFQENSKNAENRVSSEYPFFLVLNFYYIVKGTGTLPHNASLAKPNDELKDWGEGGG